MTDDVEAALRDLAPKIHVPEPPDVADAVRAEIAKEPPPSRWWGALVAAVAAFGVAIAVSPAVRAGVVELLEFAGIEFRTEAPRTPTPPPLGVREVSLDEARNLVKFEIRVPKTLGEPQKVTVHDGRFVTLHYGDVLLDEFDGTFESIIGKVVNQSDVEAVDGKYWIPRPHEVFYIDPKGAWHREEARSTGKTLLWQQDGVTYRLQGELTKERALEISAS
ncbi:hypothetical protein FKR81_21980 [Lentzea tibetensis]|uniref:DUF4367 domain-containing protein n=1 Tax=Lentzea tibetensis TaxID=2591470 RepID=A0A563EQG8_9PSEU|nr:hypothetical protein [Lentzea tibetensis]TWP49911.1 hypothetical protein FKR81_21980 [Lentzea tibetensis]